jgi:hypothetical protein
MGLYPPKEFKVQRSRFKVERRLPVALNFEPGPLNCRVVRTEVQTLPLLTKDPESIYCSLGLEIG